MATPDRVAGDHGHHGFREPSDLDLQVEHVEPADPPPRHLVVAHVAVVPAYALVAAGAESVGPLPCQDHDADVGIVARLVEGVAQLEQRLRPEGVADLGPADRDLGDPLCDLEPDVAYSPTCCHFGSGRLSRARRPGPCDLVIVLVTRDESGDLVSDRSHGRYATGPCLVWSPWTSPGTNGFVRALEDAWAAGDAVCPPGSPAALAGRPRPRRDAETDPLGRPRRASA